MKFFYKKNILKFKFEAGTSRGVLREHVSYLIFLEENGITGVGEAAPLKGLSIDYIENFENALENILNNLSIQILPKSFGEISNLLNNLNLEKYPSIRFGLETAFLDAMNGGKRIIFNNSFYEGIEIPINGLLWMGSKDFMLNQLQEKLKNGFSCIKMKIGAIDFENELDILREIRKNFSADEIEIRVDANGAFNPNNALDKLNQLADFNIHSIEQPIQPKQYSEMKELCKKSPISIALDEELIDVVVRSKKVKILETIQPQYIIIKPTLVGGIFHTQEWIELAQERNIGWWMTSALESNIGLNAIAQLSAEYDLSLPQGLGTGSLYHNNIDSPLTVKNGNIFYDKTKSWKL